MISEQVQRALAMQTRILDKFKRELTCPQARSILYDACKMQVQFDSLPIRLTSHDEK